MRERIALENERPEASNFMAASKRCSRWASSAAPARALELARGNVEQQREPLDVLVFAAGRAGERRERRVTRPPADAQMGLHDRRIEALQ